MNPILMDVLPWVRQGYCCSQILLQLALQLGEEENPALVRTMWGFCQGMAQNGEACGMLTGGVAALSYFVGHGARGTHAMAVPIVTDFVEWFRGLHVCAGEISCPAVTSALLGKKTDAAPAPTPDPSLCGELLAQCWEKILELLAAYEIDPSAPRF